MSIDITIRQTSKEKKTLPLPVILGPKLSFGDFDGQRLDVNKLGDTEFVAFDSEHIARGISVTWNQYETEEVEIRILVPTNPLEMDDAFDMAKRIAEYWDGEIAIDGGEISIENLPEQLARLKEFNESTINTMLTPLLDKDGNQNLTLFSTMWPLYVGKEEAELFTAKHEEYYKWLHEKQTVDAYYAAPRFYSGPAGIIGRYILSEDIVSIVPLVPTIPFGMQDPTTGEALKCDDFKVLLFSTTKNAIVGECVYDKFIEYIKDFSVKYDAANIIYNGLSAKQIEEIVALDK